MTDTPLLSVGMSVRNNAATLALAVRSLIRQTFRDWELILIDDGSVDDTAAVVRTFGDTRIRLVMEPVSRGLACRLNQAVDRARGRFFARMDGDDVCFPERFACQVDYLQSHPDIDLLGTGGVVFDSDGRALGIRPAPTHHDAISRNPWSGFYLAHPSWMGRTEWFRRHRYDERAVKAQDYDLLLRAYRSSRFAALPEPLIGYREERLDAWKNIASRRQVVAAQWRHAQRSGDWHHLPLAWLGQLAKGTFELAVIGTSIDYRLLGHRAGPLDVATVQRWDTLWRELQKENGDQCAA